jgi:hypothetical protein
MSPTEFWLPVGAVAFYLYDAAHLLWQNELVYERAGARWRVEGGSSIRLGARRLFMPNPLLPQRPLFLVCWSAAQPRTTGDAGAGDDAGERSATLDAFIAALRPIGLLNILQLGLLCLLPAALWSLGTGIAALGVFALFYLATLIALGIVWRRRAALALSKPAFWSLCFDALACAPFAINLTRRLSLRHGLGDEPLRFAACHFDAATLAQVRTLVTARVREEHAAPDAEARQREILSTVMHRLEP